MKKFLSLILVAISFISMVFVKPVTAENQAFAKNKPERITCSKTASTTRAVVRLAGAPVLKSLKNANNGLVLRWGAVTGADYYRVYRRASGENKWTFICAVKSCSYTDEKVKSGVSYRYTVRSVNNAGFGECDKVGIATKRLSLPNNIKAANNNGFIKVTWGSVKGATAYRVYRRAPGEQGWSYIRTVKTCEYNDKDVINGYKYRYTVIATYSKVYSSYCSTGALIKCVSAPVTQKVITYPTKLVFEWTAVKGAGSYRVYRRGAGESWKLITTVKDTAYTDMSVRKGQKYRYTVRAVSDGYLSGFDSDGVLLKYMAVNGQIVYGKNANYQRPGTINKPTIIKIDKAEWNLTVVNSGYRIPSDYETNLVRVCGSNERLDRKVAVWYEEMYKAAAEDGVYLTPCSGYRSYELQERNYNRKVQYYKNQGYSTEKAKIKAATIIMPPGSSEHNLGYAMDIVCVEEYFEDSKQFKWLQKNAADYGFILRYPKDKQSITKVTYEPWHWRYVGVEAAHAIKSSGLTLEEYMGVK